MDFNYLPPMVIPIAILLYCGNIKIRQQLEGRFFKISLKDKRKQVLSGAWDITYLSLIRYKELSDSNNTILVTDDDTLSILARAIKAMRCTINENFIDISSQANKCTAISNAGLTQYCDSEALNDFRDVYNDLLANRAHGSPCFPDKKLCCQSFMVSRMILGLIILTLMSILALLSLRALSFIMA